jgi:tRNA pseudouridine55 synthase
VNVFYATLLTIMQKYVVLHKKVGETPLECAEAWRAQQGPEYASVPLAYAGRLDPMASGKLLVLIGEECKQQESYHGLDKAYEFSVLFGVKTDTADVLGRIQKIEAPIVDAKHMTAVTKSLIGNIELPYPHFSSKTVQGKPLHVWTLEGRLDEITIPTKASTVFKLNCTDVRTETGATIYKAVRDKIETIAPVTDERKALGNDFRRVDVRADWKDFLAAHQDTTFTIATFTCIVSSGTYMRTLAEVIAEKCNTVGLAYSIHRTVIGRYTNIPLMGGMWTTQF